MTLRVEPASGNPGALAEILGTDASEARERLGRGNWLTATDGTSPVAAARWWRRPDAKTWLWLYGEHAGAYRVLAASFDDDQTFTSADADDENMLDLLRRAGFSDAMVEVSFRLEFTKALEGLRLAPQPAGYRVLTAEDVERDELFALDTKLRNLVPGTEGWAPDRNLFDGEMADSPPYDPAAYLVAVGPDGDLVGLFRMWRNPSGPRLGLLAVLPQHRRSLIAATLMRRGLEAAASWGHDHFVTETTTANRNVFARLARIGTETGRRIHLRFSRPGPGASPRHRS